jgi:NTE family protein
MIPTPTARVALVLAGGGARGAYEAGVLRFLFETLPRRAGERIRPAVVCGTSAGAVNGAHAVAAVGDPGHVHGIVRAWQQMRVEHVFRVQGCDLVAAPARTFGAWIGAEPALVDVTPFRALVEREVPWGAMRRALGAGDVDVFAVTATDIDDGRTILYVDGSQRAALPLSPGMLSIPARIGARHCLASSAMPFLFPPVELDRRLLADGGLRLNTPLSPALHLGANRLLVVGTQSVARPPTHHLGARDLSLGFLLGKALGALMLDPVEADLRRLTAMNEWLGSIDAAVGPGSVDRVNAFARASGRHAYETVEAILIRPSQDVGALAASAWRTADIPLSAPARVLLGAVAATERADAADLLSFLLFDRAFTAELERLGHADALADEERIARLFGLGQPATPDT